MNFKFGFNLAIILQYYLFNNFRIYVTIIDLIRSVNGLFVNSELHFPFPSINCVTDLVYRSEIWFLYDHGRSFIITVDTRTAPVPRKLSPH